LKNLIIAIEKQGLLDYFNNQKIWDLFASESTAIEGYQQAAK
jgi:hypothetical protein